MAGRPDLIEDPRFKAKPSRKKNYCILRDIFNEAFAARPRAEWLAELEAADVPCGPISEALADPQVEFLGMLKTYGEGDRAVSLLGCAVDYKGTITGSDLAPPLLGEHTREVFLALGYGEDDISHMLEEGAI